MLHIQKSNAAAHSTAAEGTALKSAVMCVVFRSGEKKKKVFTKQWTRPPNVIMPGRKCE